MPNQPETPEYLGYREVAVLAGVAPGTLRSYAAAGRLPDPDVHLGQSPGWRPETIDKWLAQRPGRGTRTDLRR